MRRAQVVRITAAMIGCWLAATDLGGCLRSAPRDDDVREYVRLVVALGSRDHDSIDYAYPPAGWIRDELTHPPPLATIRDRARSAADRLDAVASANGRDAGRWTFLARQLRAVEARADLLLGRRVTFDEEAWALFGIRAAPADAALEDTVRRSIGDQLPGPGALVDRLAAFERGQLIPPDRARAVFERALAGCRQRSAARVPLPADEHVDVVAVSDSPWPAYSRYRGGHRSTIQIDLDDGLTVDGALSLACHEGYPGHHARNTAIDVQRVAGQGLMEFTVQPLFSPEAIESEAAALRATDDVFPGAERARFERDALYPLAGLDASDAERGVTIARLLDGLRPAIAGVARRYLDGELEFVRAGAALREHALVPQPDPLLKFFNQFRSYAVSYAIAAPEPSPFADARASRSPHTMSRDDAGSGPR